MTAERFTATDKRTALERELRYRHRVYGRLVAAGSMTEERREREIAVFDAMAEDYCALERADELPLVAHAGERAGGD